MSKDTDHAEAPRGRITHREAARQRQDEALRLRVVERLSFDQIADRLKYADKSGAKKAVEAALDRLSLEPVKDARVLALAELEALTQAAWQVFRATPEGPAQLRAIDQVLRIMERRSRLLGLDAPAKSERTIYTPDRAISADTITSAMDAEISKLTAELEELDRTGGMTAHRGISDPAELAAAAEAARVADEFDRLQRGLRGNSGGD